MTERNENTTETLVIEPLVGPVHATVRPPGSKSMTNRALMVAALASGTSELSGALDADDTEAMVECLQRLGVSVDWNRQADRIIVTGIDGSLPAGGTVAALDARLSGTTSRFMMAMVALGSGPFRIDGEPPLRARPMGDGYTALAELGVAVDGDGSHLPVTISGGPVRGGHLNVRGDTSSQFLSGLAMAGVCMADGLDIAVRGDLVSAPYVAMTAEVMRAFGAEVVFDTANNRLVVKAGGYRARSFAIEADASAATYFMAIAAISGGDVRIEGVGKASMQGDIRFADILESMGAQVTWGEDWLIVSGPPLGQHLQGIDVNMADLSDAVPTLAAVAVFADRPTTVRGVGFIRHKETDRIGSVVTELQRLGIGAEETDDGFVVHPGEPQPACVRTYDDHRMAMAFTVIGTAAPGITIGDPGCVAKTFPGFFDVVEGLRRRARSGG